MRKKKFFIRLNKNKNGHRELGKDRQREKERDIAKTE
jgi:hypothetical protein